MATPTDVQSVTVTLRAGVSDATLPNNVKMRYGYNYAISLEDWSKISAGAKATVIAAPTFNTATTIVPLWNAANYTLDLTTINNYDTIANLNGDAQAAKDFALGDVVLGFNDNAFKLVLASSGSATIATGSVVLWGGASTAVTTAAAKAASTVTSDFSDVTSTTTGEVAGVAIGTITAGQYGWIQIAGTAYATKVETNVAAGDAVAASDLTDEKATSLTSENQTVEVTGDGGAESYKIKFTGGTDSAAILGSATAATVQTVLEGLLVTDKVFLGIDDVITTSGVGYVTVTGDGSNPTPYNITFSSSLGALPDLIEGAQVGGDTISLVVNQVATGSQGLSASFGTAQTSADTGTANILLRSRLARSLRSRERDIFRNARN